MKDVYVITGATGGIGSDIAKNITKTGIVVITDLDEEKLIKLQKEMKQKKIKAEYLACDISDRKEVRKLVNFVKDLGNFKAVIHTAGVSESMKNARTILEINLVGTKYLMDTFYEIAEDSIFINIASMMGHMVPDSKLYNNALLTPDVPKSIDRLMLLVGRNTTNAYAFSKKGILLLTEYNVEKWAEKNSRIISVSPGAVRTPLSELEAKDNPAVNFMIERTPVPRYGEPEEITSLIKYLISKEAAFITGTDILIDGGITSHMKYNDIFGLKKNKVPIINLFAIYIIAFLVVPLFVNTWVDRFQNPKAIETLSYFVFPAIIILTTMFYAKKKLNLKLILFPIITHLVSSFILYGTINIFLTIFYGLIATGINVMSIYFHKKWETENNNENY